MRAFRIFTLVGVPFIAGMIAFRAGDDQHLDLVGVLVFLWTMMIGALAQRYRERSEDSWAAVDVLTGNGRMMMWSGLAAMIAAMVTGWASFAVVGVLGIGIVCLAATWTTIVAGGDAPWRAAEVVREILPKQCTEGDTLREEIALKGVRIPMGTRLFLQGRATAHGMTTRYVVGGDGDRADVKLESELGGAPRGDHQVPPLAMWLADVLGLARTPIVHKGETTFAAVPKPSKVDDVKKLLGDGKDAMHTRETNRFPTEGTFRIREYNPGDDTRRIHWVRSLQMNQLVVRLPDEIPQAEPAVRLILDTCLPAQNIEALTCQAHEELLDAMVRVWLGIGNALAEQGTRVTLVTGVGGNVVERQLVARSSKSALRLGAQASWQSGVATERLFKKSDMRQIVVTCRSKPIEAAKNVTWIVVPEVAWTTSGWWPVAAPSWMTLPFPTGSAENRMDRRRREKKRVLAMWEDRSEFNQMIGWVDWRAYAGVGFCARPADGRVSLVVVP
jgi:uncharacterized protein (DUF58 family)